MWVWVPVEGRARAGCAARNLVRLPRGRHRPTADWIFTDSDRQSRGVRPLIRRKPKPRRIPQGGGVLHGERGRRQGG
eukprot:7838532-Lingulodinium_polyedra.AAC.1